MDGDKNCLDHLEYVMAGMVRERVLFTWSGGKDSAMALYKLLESRDYEVVALLTTLTREYGRVSMHGVREVLLEEQADSIGLRLEKIYIARGSSNEDYDARMREALTRYRRLGVSAVAFGDILLEDVRRYREESLSKIGMKALFPIWGRDTAKLAREFIDLGFKAIVTCVDSKSLDRRFVGRIYDEEFLRDLPTGVDPCGENGEFHTFVYDGPIFRRRIRFRVGRIVFRDNRFYFCDLIPVSSRP